MSLVMETTVIRQLVFGEHDRLQDGCLQLDRSALREALETASEVIAKVTLHAVSPGDATRIHCCKDVIAPGLKLDDEAPAAGRRRVLENLAVVSCGPIVGFQEGIIDMSGPGAEYTPFSKLLLLGQCHGSKPAHEVAGNDGRRRVDAARAANGRTGGGRAGG